MILLTALYALQAAGPEPLEVEGTILSVRGAMLTVRPSLRPKLTRVHVGPKTQVVGVQRSSLAALEPGMRVAAGGPWSPKDGFKVIFVDAAKSAIGWLSGPDRPPPTEPGFGIATGTLKSREPFVISTSEGKEYQIPTTPQTNYWYSYLADRKGLLIGTRVTIIGHPAPDGVVEADQVMPDRNFAPVGTMFGTIVGGQNGRLQVRPKYSPDTIWVDVPANATLLREVRFDPTSVRVGETVSVWGHPQELPPDPNLLSAIAILRGPGRYPRASGEEGGLVITGRVTSLMPEVVVTSGKRRIRVQIPAQLITARVVSASRSEFKPAVPAMFTLKAHPGGGWTATHIVLDASPWVGYGN